MKDPKIPNDILPDQLVEDDDGNIVVISEEYLMDDARSNVNPITETEIGEENMENDMPCSDVMSN